jgi:hypothetical protein
MPIRSGLEAFILRAGGIFGDYRDRTVSGKIAETAVRLEQIHKVLRENDKMMLGGTPGDELSSTYMECVTLISSRGSVLTHFHS